MRSQTDYGMAFVTNKILIDAVNDRVRVLDLSNINEIHIARLKREICAAVAYKSISKNEALEYLKGWVPANGFNGVKNEKINYGDSRRTGASEQCFSCK